MTKVLVCPHRTQQQEAGQEVEQLDSKQHHDLAVDIDGYSKAPSLGWSQHGRAVRTVTVTDGGR